MKKSDHGVATAGLYGPVKEGTTVPVLDMDEAELESPSSSGRIRDPDGALSSKSGGSGGRPASLVFAKARERSDIFLVLYLCKPFFCVCYS